MNKLPETSFNCLDCAVDTMAIGEYYHVRNDVWNSVANPTGMLCIACLEARLGRRLSRHDFTFEVFMGTPSERLTERMK